MRVQDGVGVGLRFCPQFGPRIVVEANAAAGPQDQDCQRNEPAGRLWWKASWIPFFRPRFRPHLTAAFAVGTDVAGEDHWQGEKIARFSGSRAKPRASNVKAPKSVLSPSSPKTTSAPPIFSPYLKIATPFFRVILEPSAQAERSVRQTV